MSGSPELAGLYDDLARWQWRRRKRVGMALRKRLVPGPARPRTADDVDSWLFELSGASADARMLDVGCGFGLTLVRWTLEREGASGHGLTIAPWQADRAREHVAALGLTERVQITLGSFEEPPPGPFDLVVSIESLCHAPDLGAVLHALAGVVSSAGRLVVIEDVACDAAVENKEDGRELRRLWATQRLWSHDHWRDALAAAGWVIDQEIDLTDRVPAVASSRGANARRLALRIGRRFSGQERRRVCDAFLGGIALERLYAHGAMRYVVFVCGRKPCSAQAERSSAS